MKLKTLDVEKTYETQGGQGFRLRSVKTMNDMKIERLDTEKAYERHRVVKDSDYVW